MIDLSIPVATAFALLSALHLYWAAGGRAGAVAALPERNGAPTVPARPREHARGGRASCGVARANAVLAHAVGDSRHVGFFKKVRDTRFARLDTRVYSPIALLLGAATAFVAWSTP